MAKNAASEIIASIAIMIENAIKQTTRIDNGIITAINTDGTYTTKVRGKSFDLYSYTPAVLSVGIQVKVIIPQGQMSQAFILGTKNG